MQPILEDLGQEFGEVELLRFESVGPAVGAEVTRAAGIAVAVAALFILAYIVFAFRNVPNAFRYGACAIAAMIHDILVTVGLFAIAGLALGWEADALFLTALLTVIGFSVQDTIVVFDRIRENIPRRRGEAFETIANRSLLETLHRSLATQLNAIFVLVALLLLGGATTKQFVAILLVGLISGTYSSIFTAVPLLVTWETGKVRGQPSKATA
jgi:preprotein translocase SecF subunit